jgi:predicted RNase H-like HicB family nuclease
MNRYLIIIEDTSTGYSAYSPDLPGCAATGHTREEVEREMRDGIEFHIEGMRLAGEQIPAPRSQASYCEVAG